MLEPLYRFWVIEDLATTTSYRRAFPAAGLRIRRLEDLSDKVGPNWERGYQAALGAVGEPIQLRKLLRLAASTVKNGSVEFPPLSTLLANSHG
jgi:hypothetical protein